MYVNWSEVQNKKKYCVRNKERSRKTLKFKKDVVDREMKHRAKVNKFGKKAELDQAVYVWFKQKRMEGIPDTGPMICEKALELSEQIVGNPDSSFVASEGWKWRFCQRHGI